MAANIPQLPSLPLTSQPRKPLPQIPSTIHRPEHSLVRDYELSIPLNRSLPPHGRPIPNPSVAASTFERESSVQHVSPVSGVQTSISTPVTSVSSGSGKRKGPPEVQWDASKDRKYARLYSLSDADIDDLPIIMRDDKLKFE